MSSSGSSSVSALSTKAILLTAVAGVALSVGAYLLYRKHKESKDVAERTAEGRQHFSAMAETYDNHPAVKVVLPATVKALTTGSAAGGVLPFALSADTTDVLDFGCGTGSLALALASHVRSVLAVDTAPGMIEVVKKRIAKAGAASGAERVVPWLADVQSREDLPASHRSFDLIVSSLAFHHIANPKPVLDTLVPLLKPGGALVLVEMERSEAFTNALRSVKAKGHGGHGHGGDGHGHSHGGDGGHGHSHGGGHGHSHGGGEHGHSHGGGHGHSHGGSDEKKNAGGVGSSAPPDVFHAGFEVPALVELVRGAGLSVDTKATTGPAGAVVSPFVAIPTPGGDAPACLVVGIKQSKAKTN